MANTRENLIKMSKNSPHSGRTKGTKNKSTILKEQAETDLRELMLNEITPEWITLIKGLIKKAKGGEDTTADIKALTFLVNQGAGRATERKELDANADKLEELTKDIRVILEAK